MSTTKIMDELLPKFGVDVTFVDQSDTSAFEKAIRPNTKLIMVETPANPTLVLTDLAAVCDLARQHGIIVVADNTFASLSISVHMTLGLMLLSIVQQNTWAAIMI